MIGDEPHPPYERPPLSKAVLLGTAPPQSTHLFPVAAWDELAVEHIPDATAACIDADHRRVRLSGGRSIPYERLLLATGGGRSEKGRGGEEGRDQGGPGELKKKKKYRGSVTERCE